MNLHTRVSMLVAVIAMGLAFAFSTRSADAQTVVTKTKSEGGRSAMIAETASATVKAIDPATRTLTLATEGGEDVSIQCGKNVVNFDQIKVGDIVRAAAVNRVAVSVGKGSGEDLKPIVSRAPEGAKPGILVADTDEVTATIEAIDAEKRTVTLKGPQGKSTSITAGADVDLAKIKPGDDVTFRATKGVAIWVEKPEDAQPAAAKVGGEGAGAVETITKTATVESVDAEQRTITIKNAAGATKTIQLGKEVINFHQIKAGDQIRATLAQPVVLSISKDGSGESAVAEEGAAVALAPKGAKPGIVIAESAKITGKVESVDAEKQSITLSVDGKSRTLKAAPKVDLSQLKAGDQITARATQGLAIVVEKP